MTSVFSSLRSLMRMFDDKTKEFISEIDNVHMVWLEEIQQEANHMFSRDFSAEPELMPKTPSQKKNSRRKRVSLGRQEEGQAKRRFSKGRRSNLRHSSVKSLNFITEEEAAPEASTSEGKTTPPKQSTYKNKQTAAMSQSPNGGGTVERSILQNMQPELMEEEEGDNRSNVNITEVNKEPSNTAQSPPQIPSPEVSVSISAADYLSAEMATKPEASPGRTATKIAIAGTARRSRRSSARCSLKLRHSLAGLRHSMTQESVRRASRRSMLKNKAARMGNSTCSSNISEDACMDLVEEEDGQPILAADTEECEIKQNLLHSIGRITRSVAANSPTLAPPAFFTSIQKANTPGKRAAATEKKPGLSTKRKAPDVVEESPTKRVSPPKKSQSVMKPNMRSFLHTVQKNQMLMMTPNSLGRTAVMKSFIKYTTPIKHDPKQKERQKLEALKKKQEQEEERMKKMEEDKKKKQDELKRKRDERLRRVIEAKVKEEQKEEEKKKKLEKKMAQIDEKNDKRLAEEKAKKKVAIKRQEELEQRRKLEEEARKKKQAEEEKRQQEILAKKKAEEEEERARKLAETRRALELKREQEREREKELERERLAAAEREQVEKEKALALQRELERAAREKEQREMEEKRKELEERRKQEEQQRLAAEEKAAKEREAAKQKEVAAKAVAADTQSSEGKAAGLNVTVDFERSVMHTPVGKGGGLNVTVDVEKPSPQSYSITPKGGNKAVVSKHSEDYGMDQNSDDSTDDESAPRKPIPSWAEGHNLQQIIMKQYFNPPDLDSFFGAIEAPKLENIFYKSKPRYFKRTSSAVWNSPPQTGNLY
ncbi:hypothetical protein LDENG_00292140 [Lucifuga dentata]|nr:hypothetical protein LDENG_00292140 [Lucifuga dentata]